MNVSTASPSDDSTRPIEIVGITRAILIRRHHNRRSENSGWQEVRLVIDEFLGKMLRKRVGVWEVAEQQFFHFRSFFCRHAFEDLGNWDELMVAQRVVVDFLVNIQPIAVRVERRDMNEGLQVLETMNQVDDFLRSKQIYVDSVFQ
jgi:hypothetical protein